MKRVILESPYSGNVAENLDYARQCMKHSLSQNEAPFPSHLLYPQVLNDDNVLERDQGIKAGFAWHKSADYSVVYVDRGISTGMKLGIIEAQINKLPVYYRRIYPLSEPFYILISGKRCSGKDTVAELLKKNSKFGSFIEISGFAKSLKRNYAKILANELSEPADIIYDKLLNNYEFKQKHRLGLIQYGIDEKEKYAQDIWIQRLIELSKNSKIIIIPDVRYKYELYHKIFNRENSVKIRVICSNETREKRGWKFTSGVDDNHSECDLDDVDINNYDMIIDNNSDLGNLEEQVKMMCEKYCL